MNVELTKRWNDLVGKEDIVYHLGDFAFCKKTPVEEFKSKLNGEIILIKGNHDKQRVLCGFKTWYTHLEMQIGSHLCLLTHRPIYDKEVEIVYNRSDPAINKNKYDFFIVGHIHNHWKSRGRNVNVGVDVWDYAPINYETLVKYLDEVNK